LGIIFGAETGFRLASDPDTVRAPDVAFVAKRNVPKDLPEEGFWPGAPDLAVEVLSPSDRTGEVDEKINAWLDAGCSSVWVVNSKLETVTIYHSRTDVHVKAAGEVLEGDPTLPGFSCQIDAIIR
jgi:Uma2 family endonuclease